MVTTFFQKAVAAQFSTPGFLPPLLPEGKGTKKTKLRPPPETLQTFTYTFPDQHAKTFSSQFILPKRTPLHNSQQNLIYQ